MPPTLPAGDPLPDGLLPPQALAGLGERPFGVYLHVPFCASRCGYCDFTTYTATELGGGGAQAAYPDTAAGEVAMAAGLLGGRQGPAQTVFVGGGTPTLLPVGELGRLLRSVTDGFGLAEGAEVTVEANPESVDLAYLRALREAGATRISFGMQSARSHVLAMLDRQHTPGRVPQVVGWAREAGFAHVSVDLIYGAQGETLDDWRASVQAAVETGVDHVSAYALVVEQGTRLGGQVARGEALAPDDDDLADKYLVADEAFSAAGLEWYEVSNWARPGGECHHNLAYWASHDWWGIGPGAHSHLNGVRWWNLTHPSTYAGALAAGRLPAAGHEIVDAEGRALERLLLGVRLRAGLPVDGLDADQVAAARAMAAEGLLDPAALDGGRIVLTLAGRLLADAVVRRL